MRGIESWERLDRIKLLVFFESLDSQGTDAKNKFEEMILARHSEPLPHYSLPMV